MTLFDEEFEQEAITRIKKFARIAKAMEFDVCVGFSGGKDSQVVYDLCKRSEIEFKAYFNHTFESSITLNFIKEHYPDVIWRRSVKQGFFQNIKENHNGFLPTSEAAFCCNDYKHNPKQTDKCSIVGVRRQESAKRSKRKVFEVHNQTVSKKNSALFAEYFTENCTGSGSPSIIQLKPIVDWGEEEVWHYIHKYGLPINPQYQESRRVGCIICPKANFTSNYLSLLKYPKLIDAAIRCRDNDEHDWIITRDKKDYKNDKVYYICRWLNHSFRSFTKTQQKLYEMVRKNYDSIYSANNKYITLNH